MNKLLKVVKNPLWILIYLNNNGLHMLNDEKFLKLRYKLQFNKKLDFDNPQTFNEKMQWLKLYNRNNQFTNMVDKYEAKKYISNIIGEEYIIPTIGIYNSFEDINFEKLPNKFVLKCTHDSGSVFICKNKRDINVKELRKKINKSMKKNLFYYAREWPYKNVKPRIIIEKLLEADELIDYKFYCFSGIPQYCFVAKGKAHTSNRVSAFYDVELKKIAFERSDMETIQEKIQKPQNYEKMVDLAKILSNNHEFLRVDFYNISGKIYCGELTFYPCGGYLPFKPEKYDRILGDMLKLPKIKEKNEK